MTVKLIIAVLTILFGMSQMSCAKEEAKEVVVESKEEATQIVDSISTNAEEVQKEIEEIVKEAIEQPTQYVIPEHVMAILQNCTNSHNVWKDRIEAIRKVIELENAKIAIASANQTTDSQTIKHTIRTYLATQGVSMADLGNWKPEGNKIVRVKPPEKKEK